MTIIVTLVHGTWPRGLPLIKRLTKNDGPFWFEAGSEFRDRLTKALAVRFPEKEPIRLDSFGWSGANSVLARVEMSRLLAQHLNNQRRAYPGALQFVIAHSHGGAAASAAVRALPNHKEKLFLATLAAPFISIRKRELSEDDALYIKRLRKIFDVVFTLVLATVSMKPEEWITLRGIAVLLLCYCAVNLVVKFAFSVALGTEFGGAVSPKVDLLASATVDGLEWQGSKLLVVRCANDEAHSAFVASRIGTKISHFMFRMLMLISRTVAGIVAPFLIWSVYSYQIGVFSTQSTTIVWGMTIFVLSLALALCLFSLSVILKCVFGVELLLGALRTEILVRQAPNDPDDLATILTVPRTLSGLRHSIHREPVVPVRLADWLASEVRGSHPA